MYTQRNHIVQSFYDSEVVYHKYLKSLHKQYSHYMALAQTKEKARVQSYRFLDETFEFEGFRIETQGMDDVDEREIALRGLIRPAFFPAVGAPRVKMMWIIDTGCGSDLVDARHVKQYRSNFRRTESKMINVPDKRGRPCVSRLTTSRKQ